MSKPDLCYDRLHRQCTPSWSGTDLYLNEEHERIWEIAKDIDGWQVPGDAYKLYEIAYHAGDVILEIGTYAGKSAVVEILGARANPERRRIRWFGLDVDKSAIRNTKRTLEKWNLMEYCTLFCGDLATFLKKHPISPTMVFVDGDHRYEGVKRDTEVLSSFVARDVPILFHDFLNPGKEHGECEVKRACEEWEQSGHVQFMGSFGCSALFVTAAEPILRPRASFWDRWKTRSPRQKAQP